MILEEEKLNQTMMQYFEWYLPKNCGLWNKLSKEAVNLASAGITSVWLPPAYKGAGGNEDTGYGVYDMYDLGEFLQKGSIGTKYGTIEEYLKAIKILKANNIKVDADVVFNHKMGADDKEKIFAYKMDSKNRNDRVGKLREIEAYTKFDFPERYNKYSSFKWNSSHFDGVDYDAKRKQNGIYLFYGKSWDKDVDLENGNYDYLMGADVDFNNVEVIEELVNWGVWYVNTTNIDGFRLDAVKHIKAEFFKEWLDKVEERVGKKLFCVGEYWSAYKEALEYFINKNDERIKLFDVPLHYNLYEASKQHENYDLKNIFKGTLVQSNPKMAVTFVDNHDSEPGQSLDSFIEDWFKPIAYALILLRNQGLPCVFYGDYYGIEKNNFKGFKLLIERMLSIRRKYVYGTQNDYFNDKGLIGWTLEGDPYGKGYGCAVVLSNKEGIHTKKMYIGEKYAHERFVDILGYIPKEIYIDANGYGQFKCDGISVSCWVPENSIFD